MNINYDECITCYGLGIYILQRHFFIGRSMEQPTTFNFPTTAPNLIALDFFFTRSSDKENLCRDLTQQKLITAQHITFE